KKKGKSLDDDKRLRKLNWQLALFFDDDLGVYWPGKTVHELLRSAATKWRKGEDIKRSLVVLDSRLPLVYDGPRTQEELWEQRFKDERMGANAGIGSGRVVRCRPKFTTWSLIAEIAYDPEDLDFDFLCLVVERSQKYGI